LSSSVKLDGGRSEDGFKVNDLLIKYPTTGKFMQTGKKTETNQKVDSIISVIEKAIPKEEFVPVIPDFSKIDTSEVERIVYPANAAQFKSKLRSELESGSCRILHYGDSQLEGDRISGYLRNRLQGIYGGNGPGFIPVKQVYEHIAAEITTSDNWLRFAVFDPTQKKISDKNYGLYASLSRFTDFDQSTTDSIKASTLPFVKASISVKPSKRSYSRLKTFNHVGLHYGNVFYPVSIKVYNNGVLTNESTLIADKGYHCFEIKTAGAVSDLLIELESKVSPDFYGLTLDGNGGINLDNIAMRGSSGTIFNSMNPYSYSRMVAKMDPKVLIFQYGGNTVPYVKDSLAIKNYVKYLMGHINWTRRIIPGASVIYIGPGDMSTMENGSMITYRLLPYLDNTLKEACEANGIAYWSTYKAMGGENSMQYWVDQKLAASDYTHFSPQGTRIISELFFTALYLDLRK